MGIPLGFPGMQGGWGGGLEMETVTSCAAIVCPQHPGTVTVPAPNPWDITLTRGCLACPTVLLTDMEVGIQDPLGLGKLGAQAEKDRRLRKK